MTGCSGCPEVDRRIVAVAVHSVVEFAGVNVLDDTGVRTPACVRLQQLLAPELSPSARPHRDALLRRHRRPSPIPISAGRPGSGGSRACDICAATAWLQDCHGRSSAHAAGQPSEPAGAVTASGAPANYYARLLGIDHRDYPRPRSRTRPASTGISPGLPGCRSRHAPTVSADWAPAQRQQPGRGSAGLAITVQRSMRCVARTGRGTPPRRA